MLAKCIRYSEFSANWVVIECDCVTFCVGFDDLLELLVRHGANLNATTKKGMTALMLACERVSRCI